MNSSNPYHAPPTTSNHLRLLEWLCANRSPDGGVTFFYVHAFESGMDNSPRFDRHVAVPGATWLGAWLGGGGGARPHALSVDLCALVAREMALAGRIAEELGKEEVRAVRCGCGCLSVEGTRIYRGCGGRSAKETMGSRRRWGRPHTPAKGFEWDTA